jgi:Spy/CpxP family protein refolding chaperone
MTRRVLLLLAVGCALVAPSFARAQAQDNQNRRGNFDPAQMRERYMNSIKEQLKADDDEWKVLSPKIEKLMTAQRDTRNVGGFGRRPGGGGGGGGGNADNQPQTPVAKASAELRTVLENKDTAPEDIAKKLAALREARDKARADLAAVQKELKDVLTQRQEAVLVTMGMLE